jgi:zinc transporter 5/7
MADLRHTIPAYAALLLHAVTINTLSHVNQLLALNFLSPDVSRALVVLAASILTVPLHVFGRVVSLFPPYPYVPLLALLPLPFLSFSLLFLFPRTLSSSLQYRSSFTFSYIPTAIVSSFLAPLFTRYWPWSDIFLVAPFYFAFRPDKSNLERRRTRATDPTLLLQSYLRTILASPESRKIFYFLLLNLAFMLVQMLYGVWTNSLGLISDAIHMAFDCMAIAMGLFASVMSGWERNERFTYGYGRVETLSGFANGIFLILISVFIVFEAVQRLFVSLLAVVSRDTNHSHRLDPPEMNTNQLLLVSSVGLGVNLFGIFAMGGHHHHVPVPPLIQFRC